MDLLALWIGRVVLVAFGLAGIGLMLFMATSFLWRRWCTIFCAAWVWRAMRHYRSIEPQPRQSGSD